MFSNTEFNHLKLKLDQLYLSLSGGKVNGETVFSKKVTFGSGNKVIKIYDGKIEGLDSPEGHTYDLESSDDKSEVTLTEDGADKTTLPLVNTFVGTRTEWNALSAMDKAKYRIVHFTDEQGGYSDAYDIPYRQTNVGNGLDILNSDLKAITDFTVNVPQIIGKLGSKKIYQAYFEGVMPTQASGQQAMHDLTAYLPDNYYRVLSLTGAVQQSNVAWFPANTIFNGTANQNNYHFVAWINNKKIYVANFHSDMDSHPYYLTLTYIRS